VPGVAELTESDAEFYGGQWFLGETIDEPMAKRIVAAFGGTLINKEEESK
jgi:hypothetical protein